MSIKTFSNLLSEADLLGGQWDADRRVVALTFDCLRRHTDGTEMSDRRVSFQIHDVRALLLAYDSGMIEQRPSQFQLPDEALVTSLDPWPFTASAPEISVNHPLDLENAELAAKRTIFCSSVEELTSCKAVIAIEVRVNAPCISGTFICGGEGFVIRTSGAELSREQWSAERDAWWSGWERHWSSESEVPGENEVSIEDTIIPAGRHKLDTRYEPPWRAAFEVGPHDLPRDLVFPIQEWFEAMVSGDWERCARAYPDPAAAFEEHVAQLALNAEHFFGRWSYARELEDWWIEGRCAFVRVRGLEYIVSDEENSGTDEESVWDFALRKRQLGWVISCFSQGWPRYGSAPRRPDRH